MRMNCSLSSARGPDWSSELLWTLPFFCLQPHLHSVLSLKDWTLCPTGYRESWGVLGVKVRAVWGRGRGGFRCDPRWGKPGACRGSGAPARGSPAHAPALPLRCCRSFCRSRSSSTLPLRPLRCRTPHWPWWRCRQTWRSGRRRYGGGQSRGPSAARCSENTPTFGTWGEGRRTWGWHTHTHRCRTQMWCEQVTDINRAKAHKGHYGFREKKTAGDVHLVASWAIKWS